MNHTTIPDNDPMRTQPNFSTLAHFHAKALQIGFDGGKAAAANNATYIEAARYAGTLWLTEMGAVVNHAFLSRSGMEPLLHDVFMTAFTEEWLRCRVKAENLLTERYAVIVLGAEDSLQTVDDEPRLLTYKELRDLLSVGHNGVIITDMQHRVQVRRHYQPEANRHLFVVDVVKIEGADLAGEFIMHAETTDGFQARDAVLSAVRRYEMVWE